MTRRNLIVMFLCTELMFQGVTVNLIAFGHYHGNLAGQSFVIFVLVIAAAEASLALGLVVLLFRQRNTLDADAWRELKGGRDLMWHGRPSPGSRMDFRASSPCHGMPEFGI